MALGIPNKLVVPSNTYISNRINMAMKEEKVALKAIQLYFVSKGERLSDGRLISNANYADTVRRLIELATEGVDIEMS